MGQGDCRETRLRDRLIRRFTSPAHIFKPVGAYQTESFQDDRQEIQAARPLVEPGGAIAVCCTLTRPPGHAVQALVGAKRPRTVLEKFGQNLPEDTLQAVQLLRARKQAHLFLLSGLDAQLVEGLQITPLVHFGQLIQLIRHAPSCIVLLDAAHAMVRIETPEMERH